MSTAEFARSEGRRSGLSAALAIVKRAAPQAYSRGEQELLDRISADLREAIEASTPLDLGSAS